MRMILAVVASLTISLIASSCYAQSSSSAISVSGDFGRNWISSIKAQNPEPADQNPENDLWSWGSSPKGSKIVNGKLVADPYYIWKSLNYSSGWLGQLYVDPNTGNPVYGYIDPFTGMTVSYYMDPKTGKPVYTDTYSSYEYPYIGSLLANYPYDYGQTAYVLPSIFT
jgi:hypothetical protein